MKSKGFTLIEMVVVIAIIGVLTIAFFANYRGGAEEFALKRSIHQVALDIRRAQGLSTATQEFYGTFQGGYGVYLSEGSANYILFIDCDSNGYYSGSYLVCSDCTGGSCITERYPETVETISLEGKIIFSDIIPNTSGQLSILFTPPDPTVTFYPDDDLVTITIEGEVAGALKQKTVEVNKAGLIEVK